MKTTYSILTVILSMMIFAGCQSLTEDPKGTLTPVTYFKTQSDLDASVAAMYIRLARDGGWGFTSKETSYFGSDDYTTDPGLNKQDQRDFDKLAGGSTNQSMVAEWQGPWETIYQANNVIENYSKVSSTEELKNASAGQAYFLRGLCYYYLVRTFGPVPVILGSIDVNDRPPRDEVSKVYEAVVSDLQMAKTLLGTKLEQGKPNRYAASSLLADVYLTMAGWPLNKVENYALAASEAKSVIDANVYNLNTPYDKVFTTNNSTESIFALQYNIGGGLPNRRFGSSNVPLDEVAVDGSSGWDDVYPEITFFENAPKCTRTDLTFYTTLKLRQPDKTTFKLVPWSSAETHAQHPYYKKFRAGLNGDGVKETDSQLLSIQPSTNKATDIIRYPLVLLCYAEASAMASAPTADSYAAINLVRKRAGLPDLTPGLSQTAFRDAVVYERAYEFAGEFGVRWFDIVRLQMLPQIIAARNPVENPIPTGTNISQKYIAPIPYTEMVRNPEWQQNAGY
ncbi:RagB/SusD family nutrient uptake outer membrane protein [Dyadobacter subterraneus]|uniref:RagB/SusD family nutrient uptake outer membrane protein n=1 Tax=Dyadobacter subterraneus TaxID=2773304 RepID=A0ABR9WI07_9BACT|nr:RagB/SusD family nutrient uptake outer membrane protein [Dyadobacter subterraneus]MBE9464739.1 RagB/SusD family nutrient uptake outer membrane protein [Dyadobacter subterraneus]